MSSNVCILDNGPACEPAKLIVEIIGKQHPDTQKLLICDAGGQPLDGVTAAAEEERVSGEGVASLLKIWDWEEQPGEKLYMEIATTSGAPIRLPLMTDLRATPRQDEAQLNQIVPVVPCTALPGFRRADDLGIPVLARSGYIYVFHNGKLWRELEVRFTEEGTRYYDIDVERYRDEQGFINLKRRATGVALEDIWLPSQFNGRWPGSVQLMYSEIPLSASRLQRYERHENFLNPRVRSPQLLVSETLWQARWADSPDGPAMLDALTSNVSRAGDPARLTRGRMELNVFPVSLCARQRQRQPGHEWLLDQPARMLCDLGGGYPQAALNSTRQTADAWRRGEALEPAADFESDAWRTCHAGCEPDALAVWQAQEAQTDALKSVRDRKLYAILIEDPMHRMRHLHSRIDSLQQALKQCTQLAIGHPHHASALLLQNLAVPSRIGFDRNPFHVALQNKLNEDGKREINIATAAVERANIWTLLESAQRALAEGLKLEQFQQCLGDHLCLDDFDYCAAMLFAAQLMAGIASSPAQIDPLALKSDIHDAVTGARLHYPGRNPGQQLMMDIANRETHPLHVMLWPEIKDDELFAAYRSPTVEEPNSGDGRFRAAVLARLEDQDAPAEDSETLDGMMLAGLMQSGTLQDSFTAHPTFKAGMSVLTKINEILNSAVTAAANSSGEVSGQISNNNEVTAQRRAEVDQARQTQSQHRAELGGHAELARIKLYSMSVQHLRQTMPNAFDGARFVRSGSADIRNYYLFGLEDLPEVDPNAASAKIFGQYLDGAGNRLATTDRRSARASGMPIVPETGFYFAIPQSNQTTEILRKLNLAINNETLAGSGLLAARAQGEQLAGQLQRANENLRRAREGRWHQTLNSKPFSAMVLMMEVWNVRVAMANYEETGLNQGVARQEFGTFSAFADLVIALEALVSKVAGNHSILSVAGRPFIAISQGRLESIVGMRLAVHITKEVSVRLLGQIGAGLLFVGLSLSDAIHSAHWSDNAIWGHYMMAAGGLMGAAGALFAGSALFGPVGLIALTLIIGGAVVVALFSNTSFEDWLAGSAFGQEGAFSSLVRSGLELVPGISPNPRHLEDPSEAFYRLTGLFTGVRISIEPNPEFDPRTLNDGRATPEALKKRANTRITVSTNIMGMAAQLGSPNLTVGCRLIKSETRVVPDRRHLSYRTTPRPLPGMSSLILQQVKSDSLILYVNTPANTPRTQYQSEFDEYHWEVRAQFKLMDGQNKIWAFPAPSPKATPVQARDHASPDFTKTNQLLWADQENHAATGAAG